VLGNLRQGNGVESFGAKQTRGRGTEKWELVVGGRLQCKKFERFEELAGVEGTEKKQKQEKRHKGMSSKR
jgi:hypothetical protein